MKKIYLSIFASLLLVSCNKFKENEAAHLLDEARRATASGSFVSASNLIDSIRTVYPREFDVRRAALAFSDTIELEEAKCEFRIADSTFVFKQVELEEIKKSFVLEKQPKYQTLGYYVTPDYAGSKEAYNFFPEVEENGKLLTVSISRSPKLNYNFTEVEIDLTKNTIPPVSISRSLTSKEQQSYEKCYKLARCFKEYDEAKKLREKYELKVRFYERKIIEGKIK